MVLLKETKNTVDGSYKQSDISGTYNEEEGLTGSIEGKKKSGGSEPTSFEWIAERCVGWMVKRSKIYNG